MRRERRSSAREEGGRQEVGWRTCRRDSERVTRPRGRSSRPCDRGRTRALPTLTRHRLPSPLPRSRSRLPSRSRSSLSLSLFPPPPPPLRPSSSAWVRPALKLASPRLTVTQLRGHPAVGSQASTSFSPQSRALKTTLHLLARPRSPTSFALQPIAASSSLSNEWARLALKLASPSLTATHTRGFPAVELWTTAHLAATRISSIGQ